MLYSSEIWLECECTSVLTRLPFSPVLPWGPGSPGWPAEPLGPASPG